MNATTSHQFFQELPASCRRWMSTLLPGFQLVFLTIAVTLAVGCGGGGAPNDESDASGFDYAGLEAHTWQAEAVWDIDEVGLQTPAAWAEDCSYAQGTFAIGAKIRFIEPAFYYASPCEGVTPGRNDYAETGDASFRITFPNDGGYLDYRIVELTSTSLVIEELGFDGQPWILARYAVSTTDIP